MFQPIVFKNHIRIRSQIDEERIWDVQRRWRRILTYVSRDVPGFLAYLRNEMTEEELGWFSDVYEREFPVRLVPGYAESLFALCRRLPECAERLGVRSMLARNGIFESERAPLAESSSKPRRAARSRDRRADVGESDKTLDGEAVEAGEARGRGEARGVKERSVRSKERPARVSVRERGSSVRKSPSRSRQTENC